MLRAARAARAALATAVQLTESSTAEQLALYTHAMTHGQNEATARDSRAAERHARLENDLRELSERVARIAAPAPKPIAAPTPRA